MRSQPLSNASQQRGEFDQSALLIPGVLAKGYGGEPRWDVSGLNGGGPVA